MNESSEHPSEAPEPPTGFQEWLKSREARMPDRQDGTYSEAPEGEPDRSDRSFNERSWLDYRRGASRVVEAETPKTPEVPVAASPEQVRQEERDADARHEARRNPSTQERDSADALTREAQDLGLYEDDPEPDEWDISDDIPD